MATPEPGLDRHEWESELATLEPELKSDPVAALPELARLVEQMLAERSYRVDASSVDEPEIIDEFRSARDVARRCEGGEGVDPGDVAIAIDGLRAVYDDILAEHTAP